MAKKAKHKPYKYALRQKIVNDDLRWQSRCFDCKKWVTIDKLQFNGKKEIACDCPECKTINFANLTALSKGVKYELEN